MAISIQQAIIHVLDTSSAIPILSNSEMELTDEIIGFLSIHIEKTFYDDNSKLCSIKPESPFNQKVELITTEFIKISQHIATEIFTVMKRNDDIPIADIVIGIVDIDNSSYFFMLKFDYRKSYTHYVNTDKNRGKIDIIEYKTLLPNSNTKISEAFFVSQNTKNIKVLEKKYLIDGIKDFYLSPYILMCLPEKSPKQKINKILQIANKVNDKYSIVSNNEDAHIAEVICNNVLHGEPLNVQRLGHQFFGANETAQKEFYMQLEKEHINHTDDISISEKYVKRLEKQSYKSVNGVEIKVPIELYKDHEDSLEFINNPDGTISLLIKNILI